MEYSFVKNSLRPENHHTFYIPKHKHGLYKKLRQLSKRIVYTKFEVGCTGNRHDIGTNNGNYLEKTSIDFNGNNVVMCNYNSSVGDMTSWSDFPEYTFKVSSVKTSVTEKAYKAAEAWLEEARKEA